MKNRICDVHIFFKFHNYNSILINKIINTKQEK